MIVRNGTSEEFPQYFEIKQVPINKKRWQPNEDHRKKCFADKTIGISYEMPS